MIRPSSLLVATLVLASCRTVPDSARPATPQRPTLSSDTNTTAVDTLEVEFGFARDEAVALDSPITAKYGVTDTTEINVGWSPFRRIGGTSGRESGVGDVVVGMRHRFIDAEPDETSFAVQPLVKLPTADDPDFGTGELDAQIAGIATRTFGTVGVTGFYSIGAVGDPTNGSAVSHSLAIAAGAPVADRIGAFGEIAAVFVPEQDAENVFTTLGATYSPDPSLVFDAAVVLGLSDEATDWSLLIGLTKNFGAFAGAARP